MDPSGNMNKAFNLLFINITEIICSFDMLDSGTYELLVSNNNLQWVYANQTLEIIDSIQVYDAEPKLFMSTNGA